MKILWGELTNSVNSDVINVLKNNWWDNRSELDLDQEEKSMIRDILREELNVKFFPGERLTIDDFSSPIKYTAY